MRDLEQTTIIDSEPRNRPQRLPANGWQDIKTYFIFGTSTITVIVLGYGIFTVRQFLPILGLLALLIFCVGLICAGAWCTIATLRFATRAEFYPVEESGAYLQDALGRVRPLAPMTAAQTKMSRATGKVEISLSVPSLFDLIESGDIEPGRMEMVMGYDKLQLEKGVLQLVIGSWPGTFAVAGKGRSGKTRRVIAMIAQALIAGARVLVCDPHYTKMDSLARSLEPLERYIQIARGEEEIIASAQFFLSEMEGRVSDASRPCVPWLIIFDEWSRLMDEANQKMPDGGRDFLIEVATNCSTQYAGYYGFCCLIGQTWTDQDCGGTKIRRSLQSVFVHQLSAEYAAFFMRAGKWRNKADELRRRECIYRDIENQLSVIVTMSVPDDTAQRVALYLANIGMPEIDAHKSELLLNTPLPTSASRAEKPIEHEIIMLPEVASGKQRGNTTDQQIDVLRSIAKRLRNGESANDLRKSLGLTGGRALQEVNSALQLLSSDEETNMED